MTCECKLTSEKFQVVPTASCRAQQTDFVRLHMSSKALGKFPGGANCHRQGVAEHLFLGDSAVPGPRPVSWKHPVKLLTACHRVAKRPALIIP